MSKKPVPSLKATALRLLSMREHSRVELRRKLKAKAQEGEDVEAVLDRMAETGLQSDQRFAEGWVRTQGGRVGIERLRRELAERGVSSEVAAAALGEGLIEDELTRARDVWAKKFGVLPQDQSDWGRQARFMQSRGFAVDVIRKLLKEPFDESA
ncbi:recombination regulator RecX [Uliginosibacterium sp. 31-16]|uniref:recombination regulator RecX n=1 Tax=Uliginosibacterium sp. 31-16 TaxID=3068315 RepID=UPI0035325231